MSSLQQSIELLEVRTADLRWVWDSLCLIEKVEKEKAAEAVGKASSVDAKLQAYKDATKATRETRKMVSQGLRWFADVAIVDGREFGRCLRAAVLLDMSTAVEEMQQEAIAALVEIETWLTDLRLKQLKIEAGAETTTSDPSEEWTHPLAKGDVAKLYSLSGTKQLGRMIERGDIRAEVVTGRLIKIPLSEYRRLKMDKK